MKDNFSTQAMAYASFRPRYPKALYNFIYDHVKFFDTSLDIATGNGQVACELAGKFREVHATDISEKQLAMARRLKNVYYKVESAELTSFADNYFDLITVAQAVHWFRFESFYKEVNRILKADGLLVVTGYGLLRINKQIDQWTDYFYTKIIGPYWDIERKYIDEEYKTIPFPFKEISSPKLSIRYTWSKEHFIGYLLTWSAVQHYTKAYKTNPLTDELLLHLDKVWINETYEVCFPLFIRAGEKRNI